MLISKFNRLIRNKFIWGAFAFLVCVSFVGMFTSRGGCGVERQEVKGIARINGRPVEAEEFKQAKFDTILELSMMLGRPISVNSRNEAQIRRQAWERIAAIDEARALGLVTSDDEVIDTLQRDERFMENGVFSRARYDNFVQGTLRSWNIGGARFEKMLREDITLQKMQGLISAATWLSPADVERAISTYADNFRIEYVVLPQDKFADEVQATDADVRTFYEAHSNSFVVPEQVRVRYVTFPAAKYPAGTNDISEELVLSYYENHRPDYLVMSTNKAATNAPENTLTNSMETVRPLDEVRDSIMDILVRDASAQNALEAARLFCDSMTPDRKGNALTFDQALAKTIMPATTTAWFDLNERVPDISAGSAFNRAAFDLGADPEESFSDGVLGTNAAYVINLLERRPARLPDLKELYEEVKPLATRRVREEALRVKADEIRDHAISLMASNKTFHQAVSTWALNVVTTAPFSAVTAPDALSDMAVLGEITLCKSGELTYPFELTNGMAIAHIAERIPAEAEARNAAQRQVMMGLMRQRMRGLYTEWQRSLLLGGRFEDLSVAPTNAEAAATAESESDE